MLVKGVNGGLVRVGATSGMLMGRRTSRQGARRDGGFVVAFRTAAGDVPNSSQTCTREGKGSEGLVGGVPSPCHARRDDDEHAGGAARHRDGRGGRRVRQLVHPPQDVAQCAGPRRPFRRLRRRATQAARKVRRRAARTGARAGARTARRRWPLFALLRRGCAARGLRQSRARHSAHKVCSRALASAHSVWRCRACSTFGCGATCQIRGTAGLWAFTRRRADGCRRAKGAAWEGFSSRDRSVPV